MRKGGGGELGKKGERNGHRYYTTSVSKRKWTKAGREVNAKCDPRGIILGSVSDWYLRFCPTPTCMFLPFFFCLSPL